MYIIWKEKPTNTYKLDEDGKYYLNVDDPNKCFPVDDVQKYPHQFITANTIEEIEKCRAEYNHSNKYGARVKGYPDCKCPNCGYDYKFDYYDYNDGHYTAAIEENFETTVKCICGCHFKAKIEVKVSFKTEIIA
jgi:hypothetical protein